MPSLLPHPSRSLSFRREADPQIQLVGPGSAVNSQRSPGWRKRILVYFKAYETHPMAADIVLTI